MRRFYMKLMSSLLAAVLLLSLMPTIALAAGPTGSGTESDPYVYEVASGDDLSNAVAAINSAGDADHTIYFSIYLKSDIDVAATSFIISKNHVTIFGEDHTLNFNGSSADNSFNLIGTATVNLGAENYEKTLQLKSENNTKCIVGLNNQSTLNMYDHVTIGPSRAGGQAGGVQMEGSSKFNMYGGTITDCVNTASLAGAVYLDEQATFTMYDGLIENCSGYQGGAVGVAGASPIGWIDSTLYPATFHMVGGTIKDCTDYFYGGGAVCLFSFSYPAVFIMDGGTITGCSAETTTGYPYGGAIIIYQTNPTGKVELNAGEISGNKAKIGGGIFAWKGTVTISDGFKLYDNTASSGGDDIYNHYANLTLGAVSAGSVLRCGHPVDGWYDDGTGESRWSCTVPTEKFTGVSVPSGYALKAAHGSGHTVTFDTQGGSTVPSQTVFSGTAVEPTVPPTKGGYEFDGWYKNQLCTEAYDFSTPVTGDIKLYAKWVSASPHYVLKYGDGRPDDGGDPYKFSYDPANPVDLPTEVKYFSQEEIGQLPPESIYGHTNTEGTYFLAWFGYMPTLGSTINTNFPVYEKTAVDTYTEFTGTPIPGKTYYQFIPCETTPDTNLGDITYYAQWVKVKINITVDIQVDVGVSFDQNLDGNIVMIDDSQRQELAKNFKPGDIVSNNCEITLTATVANPKNAAEEAKIAEYLRQYYPECRSISYDAEIRKDIKSNGAPYPSTVLKELEAPIEIIFAIPQEWQNGTVKMLRAHTKDGTVTVSECADLDNDRSTFTLSSDEFSTYTMFYIPAGGGVGIETACTLRYQSNGGTAYPDETKINPWIKNYASLPVPVREGCTFTGWYADSTLQNPITGDVQVNRTLVTIYAGWEKGTVPGMLNGENHYAYVEGYSDGTVRPNDNITRAEVATLFFRLLKDEIRDENLSDTNTFADVTEEMWCNKAISTMALLGIVKGRTAACFDPNAPITRAEFAAICARFDQSDVIGRSTFTDIDNHWAKEEIERAAALGWVWSNTNGTFRPQDYITRAEAMTMINRMLQRVPESAEDLLPDMITWPDNKPNDWYYLAVQEATSSHDFTRKISGYETWTALTRNRDRSVY